MAQFWQNRLGGIGNLSAGSVTIAGFWHQNADMSQFSREPHAGVGPDGHKSAE